MLYISHTRIYLVHVDWLSLIYFLICIIHALYAIYFWLGIDSVRQLDEYNEPVSVIVAARNEANNLKELIPLLLSQHYDNFEVILVLNNTSDDSISVISQMNSERLKVLDLKEIPKGQNPKKFAISEGVKSAKNDALLLTDADCRPGPNWIYEMVKGFRQDVVLGYAPYIQEKGLISGFTDLETRMTAIQYLSRASLSRAYMGVGRNLGYRKSLFEQHGGFRTIEHVTGGDDDLMVNKFDTSAAVQLSSDSYTYSAPKRDWKSYIHQKTRHLHSGKQYRLKDKIFLAGFTLTHIGLFLGLANFFYNPHTALQFAIGYFPLLLAHRAFGEKTCNRAFWPKILFLDILYTFFHIFVGIRALGTKRIEWTN